MTSREDSHIKMQTVLDDIPINDFTVGDIHSVVAKIYDSIGTCEQCNHYKGLHCVLGAGHGYMPEMVEKDHYCGYFKSKQDEEN